MINRFILGSISIREKESNQLAVSLEQSKDPGGLTEGSRGVEDVRGDDNYSSPRPCSRLSNFARGPLLQPGDVRTIRGGRVKALVSIARETAAISVVVRRTLVPPLTKF